MIVAITIALMVAMICGTFLYWNYMKLIHSSVNTYTLNDVRYIEDEIRRDIRLIKEQLEQKGE